MAGRPRPETMPLDDVLDTGARRPAFGEALRFWFRLGCISFGGPAGQIAIMQHELVDGRRWIGQQSFLRGLNFCTLLPGPEAQQLATYIGWRLHGVWGGIAAGALFVIPGALVMLALSWVAAAGRDVTWVAAIFDGLKPVVIAIVLHAVWRIGKRALKGWEAVAVAAAAFLAIRVLGVDFPWIVLAAGAIGWFAARGGHSPFAAGGHGDAGAANGGAPGAAGFWPRLTRIAAIGLALWIGPVLLVLAAFGTRPFV